MTWSLRPHVLRGRNVVFPDGVRPASLILHDGKIQRVAPYDDTGSPSQDVLDAGDAYVLPGLVDTHVHINDPGRADWEGFATATAAAAAGGVTTLLDMPLNSVPATTNERALAKKMRAADGRCRVDVGFLGGVVPGNTSQLSALWNAGVFAFKCFMVPSGVPEFGHVSAADLDDAMPTLARLGATLMAHCELQEFMMSVSGSRLYGAYEMSRPPRAEVEAVKLLVEMGRKHKTRVHVVHVSAAETVELLRGSGSGSGSEGISAETCPHYLAIASEQIPAGATEFKCAPPIRGVENQAALWKGLTDETLSMVVSDHSPCPPSAKRREVGDFFGAWGGIASLELGLAVVCTELGTRNQELGTRNQELGTRNQELGTRIADLAKWMCEGPARLVGLLGKKGVLAEGADADVVIFDPSATWTVDAAKLQQRHKLTPYNGRDVFGVVRATYLRGELVYADGATVGGPKGRLLSRS